MPAPLLPPPLVIPLTQRLDTRRYVYNVKAGDYAGFVQAIESALRNPTPPYIDPDMTDAAVRERMRALIEGDWKGLAGERWRENEAKGERSVSIPKERVGRTNGCRVGLYEFQI